MISKHNLNTDNPSQRLFESGPISLKRENALPVVVNRGMLIVTNEGWEVGKVAAVVVDTQHQKVTHVLLTRPRLAPDYRLVPVNLIEQVDENNVLLDICSQAIDSLPLRKGDFGSDLASVR